MYWEVVAVPGVSHTVSQGFHAMSQGSHAVSRELMPCARAVTLCLRGLIPCPPCPQMPLDSSTLPEAERKARLRRHFPSKPKAKEEETFEGIDLDTYKKFWKK